MSAPTLLVSSATAGDQSSFGGANTTNAALGVFPSGRAPPQLPTPVATLGDTSGRSVYLDLTQTAWGRSRFDFTSSSRPITTTTLQDTSVFGRAYARNAAGSFTPVSIAAPRTPQPVVAIYGTKDIRLDLVEYRTQPPAVQLNWGSAQVVATTGADYSRVSAPYSIEQPLSIRPSGVSPPTTNLLPVVSDPQPSGRNVVLDLTGLGQPTATPTSTNFVFSGAPVVSVPQHDSSTLGAPAVRNKAWTIAPPSTRPEFATVGQPFARNTSASNGVVDFEFYFLQSQTGANVAFTFWESRAANAVGWLSERFGVLGIAKKTIPVYVPGASYFASGNTVVLLGEARISPAGFAPAQFGNVSTRNLASVIPIASINPYPQTGQPSTWGVPAPDIQLRTRYLVADGVKPPADQISGANYVAGYTQNISLTNKSILPLPINAQTVWFAVRAVYPAFLYSTAFGLLRTAPTIVVQPIGIDSLFISQNAQLDINTRRVYVTSGVAEPSVFGATHTRKQHEDVYPLGWDSSLLNFPVAYNYVQHVFVSPYAGTNEPPTEWPHYAPYVTNADRTIKAFGYPDSKFGPTTLIELAGRSVFPNGVDSFTLGADTFIAPSVRKLPVDGIDQFYSSRYHFIVNAAKVLAPTGAPSSTGFGNFTSKNLNRTVSLVFPYTGETVGTSFVAFRIREVVQRQTRSEPFLPPDVRHDPHPIAPTGSETFSSGGQTIYEHFNVLFPRSTNVHSTPWVGEPYLRNRNRSIFAYQSDQLEVGRTDVQNKKRYIELEALAYPTMPVPLVRRRTQLVVVSPLNALVMSRFLSVRNLMPDPPGLQTVTPYGYTEWRVQNPVLSLRAVFPETLYDNLKFGTAMLTTNMVLPKGDIFTLAQCGLPSVSGTRWIYPEQIPTRGRSDSGGAYGDSDTFLSKPRLTPHTIYAPSGDRATEQARRNHGNTRPCIIDDYYCSSVRKGVGTPDVSTENRTVYARSFYSFTALGTPKLTLRRQFVRPYPSNNYRSGQVVFLNVPQYINMNPYHAGIASSAFGAPAVDRPGAYNNVLGPTGWSSFAPGSAILELKNRNVYPIGTAHVGNPQAVYPYNTTPWGLPLVGYPRKYAWGKYDFTLWGTARVEYRIRNVYPVGEVDDSLATTQLVGFNRRTRVSQRNFFAGCTVGDTSSVPNPYLDARVRQLTPLSIYKTRIGAASVSSALRVYPLGAESLQVGDIQRWEAGRVKPYGAELSILGMAKITLTVSTPSMYDGSMTAPRTARPIRAYGLPEIGFAGPTLTNICGCNNVAIAAPTIVSSSTVPAPAVTG